MEEDEDVERVVDEVFDVELVVTVEVEGVEVVVGDPDWPIAWESMLAIHSGLPLES